MLTQRQIRFIEEYLACGVGSRAAIAAGYSEKTARSIASELLRKPGVKAELERRRRELRTVSTSQILKVFEHAAAMAFATVADLYDADGRRPLPADELARETRIAIQAVRRPPKVSDKTPFVGSPYTLHAKLPSMKLFSQLVGLIPPQSGRPRGPSSKPKHRPDGGGTAIKTG